MRRYSPRKGPVGVGSLSTAVSARPLFLSLLLLIPAIGAGAIGELPLYGREQEAAEHNPAESLGEHSVARGIHFEPNLGQADREVLFTADAPGYRFFLTATSMVFVTTSTDAPLEDFALGGDISERAPPPEQHVIRILFEGSNRQASASGLEPREGVSNYLRGQQPDQWVTDVPRYVKVHVADLWPGIDLILIGTDSGQVQYDFHLNAFAEPDDIRLRVSGAETNISLEGGLDFIIDGTRVMHHPPPFTYQPLPGRNQEVPSAFSLQNSNRVGFDVGPYDTSEALVIDPVAISYSTYLGGAGDDQPLSSTIGPDGSIYIVGRSRSLDYPLMKPYQNASHGNWDVILSKLSPDGQYLAYSTYLGGQKWDWGSAITVGSDGAAYITGYTQSTDFPIMDPFQGEKAAYSDAFVTKVNAQGNGLEFSTFLGGNPRPWGGGDWGKAIALDSSGNIYVAGSTSSWDFPLMNPYQDHKKSSGWATNAFVTKFSPFADSLIYSTYFGGSSWTNAETLAVDSDGNAYIAGDTWASDLPILNAFQSTRKGEEDGFLTKLNQSGSSLSYSTYLGGSKTDSIISLQIHADRRVFVGGHTYSQDFPRSNAYQNVLRGVADAFVTSFSPEGDRILGSTLFGGTGVESATLALGNGSIHLGGGTSSIDLPLMRSVQQELKGQSDAYVATLAQDLRSLLFASYFGGSETDGVMGLHAGSNGTIYASGITSSPDFPTKDPVQGTRGGGNDGFLFTLLPLTTTWGKMQIDTAPVCAWYGGICSHPVPGFTQNVKHPDGDTAVAEIRLHEMNNHRHRSCGFLRECDYWLKLDLQVQGEPTTESGSTTTVARIRWLDAAGSWQPAEGIPIEGRMRISTTDYGLDLPQLLELPSAAFSDPSGSVSVRLDSEENLWDPSGAQWIVELRAVQAQLVARPVTYVHGWTASLDPSDWHSHSGDWQTSFIREFEQRSLIIFGQDPWETYGDKGQTWFSYHKKQDFRRSGLELDNHNDIMRSQINYSGEVDLISHSLGGLVSRHLLETEDPVVPIKHVVTIATPHGGNFFAAKGVRILDQKMDDGTPGRDRYYIGNDEQNVGEYGTYCGPWWLLIGCRTEVHKNWRDWWSDSIQSRRFAPLGESLEPVMADFELIRPEDGNPILEKLNEDIPSKGQEYLFIAGRSKLVVKDVVGDHTLHLWGDGVVSEESASLDTHSAACHQTILLDENPLKGHNAITRNREVQHVAFDFVTGHMPVCMEGRSTSSISGGDRTSAWTRPRSSLHIQNPASAGLSLPPRSSSEFLLNISNVHNATFILTSYKGVLSTANFSVESPDGVRHSREGDGGYGVLWGSVFDDPWMEQVVVHLQAPGDGNWSIQISGPPEDLVDVQAVLESDYELDVRLNQAPRLGEALVFEVTLKEGGIPVPAPTINGQLDHPDGTRSMLLFRDDGADHDEVPGDGIFTADYTPLERGTYAMAVEASDETTLRSYERSLVVTGPVDLLMNGCTGSLVQPGTAPDAPTHASLTWLTSCLRDL